MMRRRLINLLNRVFPSRLLRVELANLQAVLQEQSQRLERSVSSVVEKVSSQEATQKTLTESLEACERRLSELSGVAEALADDSRDLDRKHAQLLDDVQKIGPSLKEVTAGLSRQEKRLNQADQEIRRARAELDRRINRTKSVLTRLINLNLDQENDRFKGMNRIVVGREVLNDKPENDESG